MTSKDIQQEPEARSNTISSLPRPPGLVCLKLVTQDASGLRFRRSTYGWKANLIRKLIQVVSCQNHFRINRNHQNKWMSNRMILSLPQPSGPVCLKLVTQDVSGLRFRRSIYGWKANLIRKLIQVVSHQNPFRINRNR